MALTKQEAYDVIAIDPADSGVDAEFVGALRAGRPDAYARLVDLYQTQLFNLALRVVQDREDARDVVQEVFIKALRSLPATKGQLHVRAWLYRVTINACYDHLRSARRRPVPVEDACLDRPSPVNEINRAELASMFAETLRMLPERQKVALVLKDIHGLPHAEIAEALGISRGSAEVLLFRARHGFRRRFTALSDEDAVRRPCRLAEREAARSVGSGLPPARGRRLLEHARTCPDCRRAMEKWSDAAVGLAIVFPLIAFSEGTAAACAPLVGAAGAAAASGVAAAGGLASGAGGLAGLAATGSGTGLGTAGGVAGACSIGGAAGGAAVSAIFLKLAGMASLKTTAAVVGGVCAVTAGSVAGVELAKKSSVVPAERSGSAAVVVSAAARDASVGTASPKTMTRQAEPVATAAAERSPRVAAASRQEAAPADAGQAADAASQGAIICVHPVTGEEVTMHFVLLLPDGQPLPDELWAQAWLLYDAGHTWEEVAAELGLLLAPVEDGPSVDAGAAQPVTPQPVTPEPVIPQPSPSPDAPQPVPSPDDEESVAPETPPTDESPPDSAQEPGGDEESALEPADEVPGADAAPDGSL